MTDATPTAEERTKAGLWLREYVTPQHGPSQLTVDALADLLAAHAAQAVAEALEREAKISEQSDCCIIQPDGEHYPADGLCGRHIAAALRAGQPS